MKYFVLITCLLVTASTELAVSAFCLFYLTYLFYTFNQLEFCFQFAGYRIDIPTTKTPKTTTPWWPDIPPYFAVVFDSDNSQDFQDDTYNNNEFGFVENADFVNDGDGVEVVINSSFLSS